MRFVLAAVVALLLLTKVVGTDLSSIQEAAKKGDPDAQYQLSVAYMRGEGVPFDANESIKWARLSAEQGHIEAQKGLALIYSKLGPAQLRDPAASLKWFLKAAEQGDALSQYNAGLAFMNGDGTTPDHKAAAEQWTKAAAQGHPEAICYLGLCYIQGNGVEKNPEQARKLFLRAAMLEVPDAEYSLAVMYWMGHGGEVNKVEAFAWLRIAKEAGSTDAEKFIDLLPTKMTSDEIADGMMRQSAIQREIKAAKKKKQ